MKKIKRGNVPISCYSGWHNPLDLVLVDIWFERKGIDGQMEEKRQLQVRGEEVTTVIFRQDGSSGERNSSRIIVLGWSDAGSF